MFRSVVAPILFLLFGAGANAHSAFVQKMIDVYPGSQLRSQLAPKLERTLNALFPGKQLLAADWPYEDELYRSEITALDLSSSPALVGLQVDLFDRRSNARVASLSQDWALDGGSLLVLHKSFALEDRFQRQGLRLGERMLKRQIEFIQKYRSTEASIGITAAWVGSYVWAKAGFQFVDSSELNFMQEKLKFFIRRRRLNIPLSEVDALKTPLDFANFRRTELTIFKPDPVAEEMNYFPMIPLSAAQLNSKSLSETPGEFPLMPSELETGLTNRSLQGVGKAFLMGTDWTGQLALHDLAADCPLGFK